MQHASRAAPTARTFFFRRYLLYPLVVAAALRILPIVRKADVVPLAQGLPLLP
jgi:hypothetical protein